MRTRIDNNRIKTLKEYIRRLRFNSTQDDLDKREDPQFSPLNASSFLDAKEPVSPDAKLAPAHNLPSTYLLEDGLDDIETVFTTDTDVVEMKPVGTISLQISRRQTT